MPPSRSRHRRRVFRPSAAPDYDRSIDSARHLFAGDSKDNDAEREVILDPEAEDDVGGDKFWEEQRPPHYGD